MPGGPAFTWSALLAQYTRIAQAAVALPDDPEGARWKRAVTPVITLHAVTMALAEIDELPAPERAVGVDRASLLVRGGVRDLHEIWRGEPLPEEVVRLIDDARAALAAASAGGLEWTVAGERLLAEHPGELAGAMVAAGFDGDLYLPWPGVPLFRGAPAAFIRGADGTPPHEDLVEAVGAFLGDAAAGPHRRAALRQVYRQFDFARGRPVRDLIVAEDRLGSGQPLLVAAVASGEIQPVPLAPRQGATEGPLPVEEAAADASE